MQLNLSEANLWEDLVVKNRKWLPFGYPKNLRMHGTPFFTRFFVLSLIGFESAMLHLREHHTRVWCSFLQEKSRCYSNSGVEKYRSAVSGKTVTTRFPLPSFFASFIAAATFVPLLIPHMIPSFAAKSFDT